MNRSTSTLINNVHFFVLVNLIRMIEKLKLDSAGSGPTKLPIAVFAANTKFKRSTKLSAFKLLSGRKCNPVHLIKLCNNASMQDGSEKYEEKIQTKRL